MGTTLYQLCTTYPFTNILRPPPPPSPKDNYGKNTWYLISDTPNMKRVLSMSRPVSEIPKTTWLLATLFAATWKISVRDKPPSKPLYTPIKNIWTNID